MDHGEAIERLTGLVGQPVDICVWTDERKRNLVVRVRGLLQRTDQVPRGWATVEAVNAESGRDHWFFLQRGDQRVSDVWIQVDDFRVAIYDQDGLTLRLGETTLTFMGVHRPERRAARG